MKYVLIIMLFCSSFGTSFSQSFEGEVEFKYTYNKLPEGMAGFEAMLPQTMKLLIKDTMSRLDQTMGMGMNMSVITNSKTYQTTVLMNMMGKKIAYESSMIKDQIKKSDSATIIHIKKTKNIAGYDCKKAQIIQDKDTMDVWYTDKIPNSGEGLSYKGIKGFFMEYSIKKGGMDITMTVSKISKKSIKAEEFIIPEGYDFKTEEEMKKLNPNMSK